MTFSLGGLTSFVSGLGSLATGVSAFFPPRSASPAQAPAPQTMVAAGSLGGIPSRVMRALPGAAGIAGVAVTTSELLRLARENTGKSVSIKAVMEAARVCGLEVAAATFGLTTTQICQLIVMRRRRRRRGISSADLRRTRSTIRKITNMRRDFKKMIGGR